MWDISVKQNQECSFCEKESSARWISAFFFNPFLDSLFVVFLLNILFIVWIFKVFLSIWDSTETNG